ncbi:hypothetical protein CAPTEDRAFT_194346, partial [Capitella teleta]
MHTVKLFDIFRDDAQEVIAPVYSKKCKTRKSPCLAEKRWARKHGNLRVWRRLEAGRSPCNEAQQLSSFESEQEHGKRRCTPPVYFKDYDTDGSGSLPRELKVDMQVPSAHSAKKGK